MTNRIIQYEILLILAIILGVTLAINHNIETFYAKANCCFYDNKKE